MWPTRCQDFLWRNQRRKVGNLGPPRRRTPATRTAWGQSRTPKSWRRPDHLRTFFKEGAIFSVKGNIVIISNRIVMPTKLKAEAMETLHRGNAGVNTMRERAKEAMCWPAMTGDITRTREGCKTCCVTAPSQAATPLTPLPVPDYPFQMVLSDYFDWLGVSQQKNCTTKELVSTLRNYIGTFGVMDELTTDGDPVILGHKVTEFLHGFGIKHRVSSAYHPHSNQREEAVKATGLTQYQRSTVTHQG